MNISVPLDGRPQWPASTILTVNAMMGRWPLTSGVETVTPDGRYILKNSWPTPPATNSSFSSSVVTSAPEAKPRSAASALWPNLK